MFYKQELHHQSKLKRRQIAQQNMTIRTFKYMKWKNLAKPVWWRHLQTRIKLKRKEAARVLQVRRSLRGFWSSESPTNQEAVRRTAIKITRLSAKVKVHCKVAHWAGDCQPIQTFFTRWASHGNRRKKLWSTCRKVVKIWNSREASFIVNSQKDWFRNTVIPCFKT